MKLYLVQHGEAIAKEADPERPLSAGGRRDIGRLAGFLASRGIRIACIMHSGKTRARQTADILGAALGPGVSSEEIRGLEPKASPSLFISEFHGSLDGLLIAGHLPFLAKLVSCLVLGAEQPAVVAFQPGSLVCLERELEDTWRVAWMLRPELYRE